MRGQLLVSIGNFLDFSFVEQGDSGSPLWQYHKGRAVIVGVVSGGSNSSSNCQDERWVAANSTEVIINTTEAPAFLGWIPRAMDWMINVTKLS